MRPASVGRRTLAATLFAAQLGGAANAGPAPCAFVSAASIRPPLLAEVRYATRYNFTGRALYPRPSLWMRKETALALAGVQHDLARRGLGLKIYDAYRPLSVQKSMWEMIRDERYVSNPAKNLGRHTRGTAVDVTLVDKLGRELPMPSGYDEFSPRAHRDYPGGTAEQRANRATLERAMARRGFIPYPEEWWHFDLEGWESFPACDIGLVQLDRAGR